MPITLQEQPDSRQGTASFDYKSKQTYHYRSKGSNTLSSIMAALDVTAPATAVCPVHARTLLRSNVRWSNAGFQLWDLYVDYEDPQAIDDKQQLDTGDYKFSFSTTGGTARILTSLETVNSYAPAFWGVAPDFKQAIGVTRDGDVQGVDIVVPALKFSLSYRQPLAVITDAYVRTLEVMTGTVNNGTFRGRAAGEVLFAGADGSQGTNSDPTIDYQFIRLPNIANQTIGDIVNIAKKGHEYLWVLFQERDDGSGKYVAKQPLAVYIERVYLETDFSALAIGV